MARSRTPMSIGDEQEEQLRQAIRQLVSSPLDGARDLPVLTGLRLPSKAVYTEPQDNVILKAIEILKETGKIYLFGDDVVFEANAHNGHGESLHQIRAGAEVKTSASRLLANIFICQDGETQFPSPNWFVGVLLASTLLNRLPRIQMYANRPIFDANFHLCSHGWHPESGVLVHGPCIDPILHDRADPTLPALERLPPHLRSLLAGFCFRADADLVNAVSMLLTGLLANHFVDVPKGLFLLDGNQPGLGKTLFVRSLGMVLDGFEPRLINYLNNEEELEKRICATLRGRPQSIVLIDNAKTANGAAISSQVVEANCVAPEISLRVLGKSENYTCANDKLWAVTMNDTRVSPDMVSRGLPIRMEYEGRPEDRKFPGPPPIEYAREHRQEILGELAGMVIQWNQAGRPGGDRSHRSHQWASVVGGILKVAGFPEFLANASEAAAAFNDRLVDLSALAEAVVAQGGPYIVVAKSEVKP